MGEKYLLNWFGLSLDKLKAIRETENLSKRQLAELDELIAKKENELKENNTKEQH